MTTKAEDKNKVPQVWNFRGRFATYMRELCGEAAPYQKIFDEIYHGYVFCALYGMMKGVKHRYDPALDNPDNVDPKGFRWIYAYRGKPLYNYDNLRKLILLFDKSSGVTFQERVDNALRFDISTNDVTDIGLIEKSRYGENSELVDSYVLGGLELIHEKVMGATSPQDAIVILGEIMDEFKEGLDNLGECKVGC